MPLTIRTPRQDERQVWEDCFEQYAEFYKTSVTPASCDRVWRWIFDPDNPFWCKFAVTEDGQVIGFTQYQLMHRSLSGEMVCYLSDLYVYPDQRGHGAGRALIDHVIDFSREKGLSSVRWLTQEFNYAGRRLYDTYSPRSDFILYNINM